MSPTKLVAASVVLFFLTAGPAAPSASAQSIGFYEITYHVAVEKEHWTSGGRYWQNVASHDNHADAQLMYELLVSALESGDLCDILGCGDTIIIRDVRIRTEVKWHSMVAYDWGLFRSPFQLIRLF